MTSTEYYKMIGRGTPSSSKNSIDNEEWCGWHCCFSSNVGVVDLEFIGPQTMST